VLASLVALAALLPAMLPESPEPSRPRADATPSARFVIADARVFDGERPWPRASVQVADGRIEAIGESLPVPAGYERIDAAGRTLLPGLIDAHVHTWGEARRDALRFGVTTMLDMFSDHRQIAAARAERGSLEATARADLWSAGTLATAAGGHGTQFGMDIPTLAAPDEADAWVAARKAEGSDFIKIVREDLHTFTGRAQWPTLDDATAAAVIAAAKRQGLRAVVHASGREHARASLRDGADGLVHGFEDALADPEFVALARARGAFVIATLTVVAGMAGESSTLAEDARITPYLTPGQRQTLAADFGFGAPRPRLIDTARENIRRLHAGGVTILAGSDAPNPNTAHGASLHEELEHLVRAGLSTQEALVAATSGPARAFGLDDRGRIAPGMRADLLLVDGDPLGDITTTRAIAGVWKNGQRVDRTSAPVEGPAAVVLHTGMLSAFDDATLDAAQGAGWSPTTDRIAGGASEVTVLPDAPGAGASRAALRIAGTVAPGAPWPWAGALYSPGAAPMQAVDGRAIREIVFQARGDGREYAVLLFSGAQGGLPAMQAFVAGPAWGEVRIPLEGFRGADPGQLRGFAITAGLPHGAFALEVDAVELR
jgi:imidazolonepropionase-like amidohydrolase